MKKLTKLSLLAVILVLVFSFNACVASITCISHIDKDENEKCDNCGQVVAITKTNVKSISIKTQPVKTYYALNEELDITGGVLTVVYNDGTPSADISFAAEGVSVTAPGMDSEGQKLVAVSYGGKTVTYQIELGATRFVVSFDLCFEGGTPIPAQNVTINDYADAPEDDPVRADYDFVGWYAENTYVTIFDFEMTGITANTTIYAKWARTYTITYSANYEGGLSQNISTVKGKAVSTIIPADRTGYIFTGWFSDAGCTTAFDFNADITANKTLYAKWTSDNVEMHTITFNHNYGAEPTTSTVSVPDGSQVSSPVTPTRANVSTKGHQASGFTFAGWYTDAECLTVYNFSTEVAFDFILYAKWTGTYIFEAEHVSFMDPQTGLPLKGMGASGGSEGPNMVDSPAPGMEGINASNGYYVTYLYAPGLALNFLINSDRDVADATLIFRITAESAPIAINPAFSEGTTWSGTRLSQYIISLNNTPIEYEVIEITDTIGHVTTGGRRPFSDFTIAVNLSLQRGQNVFTFLTANLNGMGGTMSATAPVIDCIKVTTSANLNWIPLTGNEFGQ